MPHIHTEPGQHDFTASAYIIRLDGPEPAIVLHMHRLLGVWLQFGGHIELDENPWQAVIHEIREESGYELSQLKLLQPDIARPSYSQKDAVMHPWPASLNTHAFSGLDHYHIDIGYAFTTREEPAHNVGDKESGQFRAFTRDELAALPDDKMPENARAIALIILDDYVKTWRQVPVPA